MVTSLNWIKDLVPGIKDVKEQEFRDAMTMSGTKVENYVTLNKNLKNIVVGELLEVKEHPNANKLVICQVNVGGRTVQIVTGAPNIKVGMSGLKVPVVLPGGKVAGGHDGGPMPEDGIKIESGSLRGVRSDGMLCSIEEMGSSRELFPDAPEEGIYILPETSKVGSDVPTLLGLNDSIFEYEITNNRVDCYSVLGIAREAAATFRQPFMPPVVRKTGNREEAGNYIQVEVKADDLCRRYVARLVTNIHLAPSPEWMQIRLRSCGIRPINNIVDITNYVMEEYGQPMHAYDYDKIAGKRIVVRRAADGDKFMTLDGKEHTLDADCLMICDGEKEIGLAGIMGGQNSMITDDVKTMLFEAATFNGPNIRKAAKRLGVRTDASGMFEKGLDPELAMQAMDRACALITELGAGEVIGGAVDVYPDPVRKREITFEPERYNALLGTDIDADTMLTYFKPLEIVYDKDTNKLIIPTFRQDLKGRADMAEEVARFYGYQNIPTTLPHGATTLGGVSFKQRVEDKALETAEFCGFSQAMTYSFESPKVFDKLRIPADSDYRTAVTISNPLGEDFSIMRTLPVNGILSSLATNFSRRNENVHLFELAKVYLPDKTDPQVKEKLPDERVQFTLGSYGDGDFFTMKGVIEEFFQEVGMRKKPQYDPKAGIPFLHPGRQAGVYYEGEKMGYLGELHPLVAMNYHISQRVYLAVIDLPKVTSFATFDRRYTGIANFPAVTRDISLVVPRHMYVNQIEDVIAREGGKNLESYRLFDIYEGSQIDADFKSVAYTITFRAKDHTLKDTEITTAMDRIIKGLTELGIELRK